MQLIIGALLLIAFIFLILLLALFIFWLNERKYPNPPHIIKVSHYIWGRLMWRTNPFKYLIEDINNDKHFSVINWDEGIIKSTVNLEVGDILVIRGKRGTYIALVVIFDNGHNTYETAFIGVYQNVKK